MGCKLSFVCTILLKYLLYNPESDAKSFYLKNKSFVVSDEDNNEEDRDVNTSND